MRHSREDVLKLLQTIDTELGPGDPVHLATLDIPSWALAHTPSSDSERIPLEVMDRLRQSHGNATARLRLQIPLVNLQMSDLPFMFETRRTPLEAPFRRLKVDLLDRADVVVSKILRGEKRDLNAIASLGHQAGLSYEPLVNSFCAIDLSTASDMRRIKSEFLQLIEALFGARSVAQAEAEIAERLG